MLASVAQHCWTLDIRISLFLPALRQNKPSFNPTDTTALVAAVGFGKSLSKCRPPGPVAPGPMMSGGPTLQQVTIGGASGHQGNMGGPGASQQTGQPGMSINDKHYGDADFFHPAGLGTHPYCQKNQYLV